MQGVSALLAVLLPQPAPASQAVVEDLSTGSGRQVVYPGSMGFQTSEATFSSCLA